MAKAKKGLDWTWIFFRGNQGIKGSTLAQYQTPGAAAFRSRSMDAAKPRGCRMDSVQGWRWLGKELRRAAKSKVGLLKNPWQKHTAIFLMSPS